MGVQAGRVLLAEAAAPAAPLASANGYGRRAAPLLWAAGAVLVLGSGVDWLVLWLLQRQPSVQWEYVALQNSLEAIPRAALGLALVAGGLHLARSRSRPALRAVAAGFMILAAGAAVIGALLAMDALVLARMTAGQAPAARAMLKIVTVRSLALSGLFTLVLGAGGIFGLRRPET